jgi:hypothetical protein
MSGTQHLVEPPGRITRLPGRITAIAGSALGKNPESPVLKAELDVAEIKLDVAKAELGVAKAELGVAEIKRKIGEVERADSDPAELQARLQLMEGRLDRAEARLQAAEAATGVAKARHREIEAEIKRHRLASPDGGGGGGGGSGGPRGGGGASSVPRGFARPRLLTPPSQRCASGFSKIDPVGLGILPSYVFPAADRSPVQTFRSEMVRLTPKPEEIQAAIDSGECYRATVCGESPAGLILGETDHTHPRVHASLSAVAEWKISRDRVGDFGNPTQQGVATSASKFNVPVVIGGRVGGIFEVKGGGASPAAGFRQAGLYAIKIALDLLHHGVPAREIRVPYAVHTGRLVQFGSVTVLEPSFPVCAAESDVLVLSSLRGAAETTARCALMAKAAATLLGKRSSKSCAADDDDVWLPRDQGGAIVMELDAVALDLSGNSAGDWEAEGPDGVIPPLYVLKVLTSSTVKNGFGIFGGNDFEIGFRHMMDVRAALANSPDALQYATLPLAIRTSDENTSGSPALVFDNLYAYGYAAGVPPRGGGDGDAGGGGGGAAVGGAAVGGAAVGGAAVGGAGGGDAAVGGAGGDAGGAARGDSRGGAGDDDTVIWNAFSKTLRAAVTAFHDAGVLHADLYPSNIMWRDNLAWQRKLDEWVDVGRTGPVWDAFLDGARAELKTWGAARIAVRVIDWDTAHFIRDGAFSPLGLERLEGTFGFTPVFGPEHDLLYIDTILDSPIDARVEVEYKSRSYYAELSSGNKARLDAAFWTQLKQRYLKTIKFSN